MPLVSKKQSKKEKNEPSPLVFKDGKTSKLVPILHFNSERHQKNRSIVIDCVNEIELLFCLRRFKNIYFTFLKLTNIFIDGILFDLILNY